MPDYLPAAVRATMREREQAATKGPWEVEEAYDGHDRLTRVTCANPDAEWMQARRVTVARTDEHFGRPQARQQEGNATFIAHARQDVPALLAHADAADAVIRELVGAVHLLQAVVNNQITPEAATSDVAAALDAAKRCGVA